MQFGQVFAGGERVGVLRCNIDRFLELAYQQSSFTLAGTLARFIEACERAGAIPSKRNSPRLFFNKVPFGRMYMFNVDGAPVFFFHHGTRDTRFLHNPDEAWLAYTQSLVQVVAAEPRPKLDKLVSLVTFPARWLVNKLT